MKKIKILLPLFILFLVTNSCYEDLDDNASTTQNINDFVWKAMNATYLYKSDIPDLANDRFTSDDEYRNYLNSFSSPESIFESLKYLPETVDRFSVIFNNYFDVLNAQEGNSITDGLEFNLYPVPGSETEIFGAITLVLNNSVADNLGLQRGQLFKSVDGITLTRSNFVELLSQNSYTLGFADYDTNGTETIADDTIALNGETAALSGQQYTENPVHKTEVIQVANMSIGYLMYNGFNNNFENQLNAAFAEFAAAGVDELVLDLRYNGGGSVQTAVNLGSMVTGQFSGEVFSRLFYNENLQNNNVDYLFSTSIEGGGAINSLNLSRVYVLTTNLRTASASELVINSLRPYIDVVVVGENTVGKTQASILLFDSPGLTTLENVNPTHTYALRPLVANSVNVNDALVPPDGLIPDIFLSEVSYNLGTLGDVNEPLLAAAIANITGTGRYSQLVTEALEPLSVQKFLGPLDMEMYID
ncbi:S41 family peptidase [Winogradskyella aurantia]|uniref:Peptidase S41 n=1 Tax=Winogradskyella aurantia TaxID=1915063 RepID=A0A265US41_9FLAO|nr:S41 family peptidase [Winogradskyella aurantia]OZV68128.1 peptidase S41 [Winogradskyella aurantia]